MTLAYNGNITPQTISKSNFSNTVLTQSHYIQYKSFAQTKREFCTLCCV